MKKLKTILLTTFCLLLFTGLANAQEKKTKMFTVHTDYVKPSMISEYESISKELRDNLSKHGIQDVNYLCATMGVSEYMFVSPLENMAELDKNHFATLSEKMGKDNLKDLFTRMDKCYSKHGNHIIYLDDELTYMPEGVSMTQEGYPYRTFDFYYVSPENAKMLKKVGKAFKELNTAKGSKLHYRVYKSGFGVTDSYYMVAMSSKNPEDWARKNRENLELTGEEGQKLWQKALKYSTKYERRHGWIRDDLGYKPKPTVSTAAEK